MQISTSQLHRAISDIASFLEANVPDQYYFQDGGETLQIEPAALNQCRRSYIFLSLEKEYENAGCYVVEVD